MENIQQPNTVNDLNQNGLNGTIKLNTNQFGDIDTPIINNNKDNSYGPKKLPMLEDILISDPIYPESKSENTRKNSVKKKNKGKEVENNKENDSIETKDKRRTNSIKRKRIKSIKKNIARKPRKNEEIGGTIKVVGKVSAKLETLIQRLGQNIDNENLPNTKTENKYVMGPKIKAALEKFNKKKEEEAQPIAFSGRKYRTIILPDSDKVKKSSVDVGKIRYIQELDEEDNEEEEYEYDEEEEEEEDDESEDIIDKNKIKGKKNSAILIHGIKRKSIQKKIKPKMEKSKNILNLSKEYSSESNEVSNNKSHGKKSEKKDKKENNSKNTSGQNSESGQEEANKGKKRKKRKKMKKKETFNFSDDKSEQSEEKKGSDDEDDIITRKLVKHKSGKGSITVSSRSYSSHYSNRSDQSNEKDRNPSNNKNDIRKAKDNPINIIKSEKEISSKKVELTNKNISSKNIDYDKFAFKEYIVKNYHPKPVTIRKQQMKKYVLSKQIDFSIFAKSYKKKKKGVMFNIKNDNNDVNKTKSNNDRYRARKSVCITNNNNMLLNFEAKYNIVKYEEKLSNIQKKKNELINEKKDINTEFAKKRKRYQSILLTNDNTFKEFSKQLKKNDNNDIPVQKNKNVNPKSRKMNVYQILQKRGMNTDFLENINTEPNDSQKTKNNMKKGLSKSLYKNDENNLEQIPEKEEDIIKETHFGVKYIVFQNKNELTKLYKKRKWNLSKGETISIFLKAVKPKKVINKLDIQDNHNNSKVKDNAKLEELTKNNFDSKNMKMEKLSLKYNSALKKESKNSDFSNESNESSSSNESNNQNIINNKIFNETRYKNNESQKMINKEEKNVKSKDKLNYFLTLNDDKEQNNSVKDILKYDNNSSNIIETFNKKVDTNYLNDHIPNRTYKKALTIERRKIKNTESMTEVKENKVGKVKYKIAKIKKFKGKKDKLVPNNNERRRKGNLYDFYSKKSPKKSQNSLKHENDNESRVNSINKKSNNILRNEFNNSNLFSKSLGKYSPGKSSDKIYRNYSTSKKPKAHLNNISFLDNKNKKNNNQSLIISYRQKIMERISYNNENKYSEKKKKNNIQNTINKSMAALRRKNEFKIKINSSIEMLRIDAIKSKMKKKLIEIDNKLIDAVNYYNGPIDISCISSKNYLETVEDLGKRALKNGYKCTKCETNYFKLTNGYDSYFVEIVKIRNNMLYYLFVKN